MAYELVGSLLGCFAAMIANSQYNICNTRMYLLSFPPSSGFLHLPQLC